MKAVRAGGDQSPRRWRASGCGEIIDEAHSSKLGSRPTNRVTDVVGQGLDDVTDEEGTVGVDDLVRLELEGRARCRTSFFAFTATPKGKTLQLFDFGGEEVDKVPFHLYLDAAEEDPSHV